MGLGSSAAMVYLESGLNLFLLSEGSSNVILRLGDLWFSLAVLSCFLALVSPSLASNTNLSITSDLFTLILLFLFSMTLVQGVGTVEGLGTVHGTVHGTVQGLVVDTVRGVVDTVRGVGTTCFITSLSLHNLLLFLGLYL